MLDAVLGAMITFWQRLCQPVLLVLILMAGNSCGIVAAAGATADSARLMPGAPGDWLRGLPDDTMRRAALAGPLRIEGAAFFDAVNYVEAQAGMARMEGRQRQISAALYRVPLGGATPTQVFIDIYTNLSLADAGCNYWIGVANYGTGRWDWQGPFADSPLVLPLNGAGLASPAGNLVLAVVVYDHGSCYCAGLEVNPHLVTVGPDQQCVTLEEAYMNATDNSTILVYPHADTTPYLRPTLQVLKPGIVFRGVMVGEQRIKLDGAGYDYDGAGSTPRAIFQFNPGADGCQVAGFELYNASNSTYNGAGVRINQANNVMVRNCEIHDNDMGIMSNGNVADGSGSGQRIEFNHIHHNGTQLDPGYNHNLYLGGASARVLCCEIDHATTGHNLKSRAHYNLIEACFIHESANRELDLVDDSATTAMPESHSVLVDNIIVKDPTCQGNHAVIHFGQDGGNDHNGTLYLVNNTISTPFISPVVTLSASNAKLAIYNNIIWDQGTGQAGQSLLAVNGGALLSNATGGYNWMSNGQTIPVGTNIDDGTNRHGAAGQDPSFLNPIDGLPSAGPYSYELTEFDTDIVSCAIDWHGLSLPTVPELPALDSVFEFHNPLYVSIRNEDASPDIGAYESTHPGPG